jgi:5-formyltetrahydrofolate cyclo-ligase
VQAVDTSSDPEPADAKRALRQRILARRASLPPGELQLAGAAIAEQVCRLPSVESAGVVAAYIGVGVEVPTDRLVDALIAAGKTVLLPIFELDGSLTWRPLSDRSELVEARYGLLQPPVSASPRLLGEAQVVVLPGLCYDRMGNRLGRGGGSYDRALKDLPGRVTTVGIALDSDIVDAVPVDRHDQRVRMIVTPSRVISIDDGGN